MCHSSLIDLSTKETKLSLLSSSTTTGLRFRKFHDHYLGVTFFVSRIQPGAWFHGNSLFATCKLCVSSPPDVDVTHNRRYWGSQVDALACLQSAPSITSSSSPGSSRFLIGSYDPAPVRLESGVPVVHTHPLTTQCPQSKNNGGEGQLEMLC